MVNQLKIDMSAPIPYSLLKDVISEIHAGICFHVVFSGNGKKILKKVEKKAHRLLKACMKHSEETAVDWIDDVHSIQDDILEVVSYLTSGTQKAKQLRVSLSGLVNKALSNVAGYHLRQRIDEMIENGEIESEEDVITDFEETKRLLH